MKVAALIDDLFFRSKVSAAAGTGCEIVYCASGTEVPADVSRIIVDLSAAAFDAVGEIALLKRSRDVPIIAFASHVDHDRIERARAAGADEVLPRSAFVARLATILAP